MSSIQNDILRYLRQQKETFGSATYVVSGDHEAVEIPAEPVEPMHTPEEVEPMPQAITASWQKSATIDELNDNICNCRCIEKGGLVGKGMGQNVTIAYPGA